MLDPNNVPDVFHNEILVRFIVSSSEFRGNPRKVHPSAFVPYSHTELSMNRLREATIAETWECGKKVANQRQKTLYGLVNVPVSACIEADLHVLKAPIEGNPNHVNVCGFPPTKEAQMARAIKIRSCLIDLLVHPPPSGVAASDSV